MTLQQLRFVREAVRRDFNLTPAVRLSLMQGSPSQITQMVVDREVDFAIATEVVDERPALRTLDGFEWQHGVVAPTRPRCSPSR